MTTGTTTVYVVYHECYEQVLGVYSTKEKAISVCEEVLSAELAAGLNPYPSAVWDEFDIDAGSEELVRCLARCKEATT